jgi:hypothetical protein
MNQRGTTVGFAYLGVHLPLLGYIPFPTIVLAGGKEYAVQGTVIVLGTSQETTGEGSTSVSVHLHRTYTVRMPTRVFVLECLLDGRVSHSLAKGMWRKEEDRDW